LRGFVVIATVVLEHRFDRTPDGNVWTRNQFPFAFWRRYLEVFDGVRVVARVREVSSSDPEFARADGDRVQFAGVTHYIGPSDYARRAPTVRREARAAVDPESAVILRVGSHLAALIEPALRRRGQPYAVEVIYDPYDMFAPGSMTHPTRRFFRWYFPRQLRRHCARACAAAYVTEHALQRRYPPGPSAYSTFYSDVELSDDAISESPRVDTGRRPARLVTVGSFDQLYKAPDVLIDAVALCVEAGCDVSLTLVGDGAHRSALEARAQAHGIGGRVHFSGNLPAGPAVRAELDAADLFVLPSRQEGLPRALVEAMARGLPCIGSDIGGIPELLSADDLVPPGDADALATKIRAVLADPQRRSRMSEANLATARRYRESELHERRVEFYHEVRRRTAAALREVRPRSPR
jgi:glycosyltransferase involved in cell wall biosynthesis